jgi:hypothetical protein
MGKRERRRSAADRMQRHSKKSPHSIAFAIGIIGVFQHFLTPFARETLWL